jgi:uncharacterized paraquat-inducible protein A
MIFFIIPIKAWVMAVIYLVLIAAEIFNMSYPAMYFPHNLFPLVALANYLIFSWSDLPNLLPLSWRIKRSRKKAPSRQVHQSGTIPFRQPRPEPADYSHKCTVCGRTDRTNPELEFRYCSRCSGYHCYCEDHISDHTHIQ